MNLQLSDKLALVSGSTYSIGGPDLVKKVALRTLPGLTINHVIDFNFASFLGFGPCFDWKQSFQACVPKRILRTRLSCSESLRFAEIRHAAFEYVPLPLVQ